MIAGASPPVPSQLERITGGANVYAGLMKGITIYAIPVVVRGLASLLLIPVYTRYLAPRDYGLMELLDLTALLFGTLIAGSFGQALFYFHSAAGTDAARRRCRDTALIGAGALMAITAALGWSAAPLISSVV